MCVVQYTSSTCLYSVFEKRFLSFDLDYWKNESWNSSPRTLAYIGMSYVGCAAGDEVKIINNKSPRTHAGFLMFFRLFIVFLQTACYSCGCILKMLWPLDDVLEIHKNLSPDCEHLTTINENLYRRYAALDYEYYEEKREMEGVIRMPGRIMPYHPKSCVKE